MHPVRLQTIEELQTSEDRIMSLLENPIQHCHTSESWAWCENNTSFRLSMLQHSQGGKPFNTWNKSGMLYTRETAWLKRKRKTVVSGAEFIHCIEGFTTSLALPVLGSVTPGNPHWFY